MKDATFIAELVPHGLLPDDLKHQLEAQDTSRDKATHFLDNTIKPSINIDDDNGPKSKHFIVINKIESAKNIDETLKLTYYV